MSRLYRPSIPAEIKCRVALRQLGEMFIDRVIDETRGHLGDLLERTMIRLSGLLGCEQKELRLDHNPALGLRKKRKTGKFTIQGGDRIDVVIYTPRANDPEHLIYRSHHAHHIKTNIRGDGAQFSDTVLMKRERHRLKKKKKAATRHQRKLGVVFLGLKVAGMHKRSNGFPPKGSRKMESRPWPAAR